MAFCPLTRGKPLPFFYLAFCLRNIFFKKDWDWKNCHVVLIFRTGAVRRICSCLVKSSHCGVAAHNGSGLCGTSRLVKDHLFCRCCSWLKIEATCVIWCVLHVLGCDTFNSCTMTHSSQFCRRWHSIKKSSSALADPFQVCIICVFLRLYVWII